MCQCNTEGVSRGHADNMRVVIAQSDRAEARVMREPEFDRKGHKHKGNRY